MPKKGQIYGFYKNAKQIANFINKEIDVGDVIKEKELGINGKQNAINSYGEYGRQMSLLLQKENILPRELDKFINLNRELQQKDILLNKKFSWKSNEASRKAADKFIKLMLENDYKKLKYYSWACMHGLTTKAPLKNVFDTPLPAVRYQFPEDMQRLSKTVAEMSKRLKSLDTNLHINSEEFKRMKEAVKSLDRNVNGGQVDMKLVAEQLEELQNASMNYVKEKGVGNQSSGLGQKRMDFALDLCEMSADYMDVYPTAERIAEVHKYEKEAMGKVISDGGILGFADVNINSKLYEELEKGMEDEMDDMDY